ncbi:hypothetical protein [Calidifontibacter indicus]
MLPKSLAEVAVFASTAAPAEPPEELVEDEDDELSVGGTVLAT